VALALILCGSAFSPALAKGKQVVFIRYPIAPNHFQAVVNHFKLTMLKQGYVEGRDVEYVDILTSTAGEDSVPQVRRAVARYLDTADIFITCGWVSLYAREMLQHTSIPQLFVPVLKSVALKMLPSVHEPPGTNLSGLYLMYPPEKILRLTRLLLPGALRYGYVYDSRIPADMVYLKAMQSLAPGHLHGFTPVYFDLAQGVEETVQELKRSGVDAYGGIVGLFKHQGRFLRLGIPVITPFTLDLEPEELKHHLTDDDLVAGLFNSFGYCGHQAALMTAEIFSGKTRIQDLVPRPAMQLAFVNLKNADRLDIYVSVDALEAVDIVSR